MNLLKHEFIEEDLLQKKRVGVKINSLWLLYHLKKKKN